MKTSKEFSLLLSLVFVDRLSKKMTPKVFISYSWDGEDHQEWVLHVANKLTENGVYVIFDRYDLLIGRNMAFFMEDAVQSSDKILLFLSPGYKKKAELRERGVGFEFSLISADLLQNQQVASKIIPVNLGNAEDCVPFTLKSFLHLKMTAFENLNIEFEQLLRAIFDKPLVVRPPLGPTPSFSIEKVHDGATTKKALISNTIGIGLQRIALETIVSHSISLFKIEISFRVALSIGIVDAFPVIHDVEILIKSNIDRAIQSALFNETPEAIFFHYNESKSENEISINEKLRENVLLALNTIPGITVGHLSIDFLESSIHSKFTYLSSRVSFLKFSVHLVANEQRQKFEIETSIKVEGVAEQLFLQFIRFLSEKSSQAIEEEFLRILEFTMKSELKQLRLLNPENPTFEEKRIFQLLIQFCERKVEHATGMRIGILSILFTAVNS